MSARRNIGIILSWAEEKLHIPSLIQARLRALQKSFDEAQTIANKMYDNEEKRAKVVAAAEKVLKTERAKVIAKGVTGADMLAKAEALVEQEKEDELKAQEKAKKQQEETVKAQQRAYRQWEKDIAQKFRWAKTMGQVGVRLGWLGYRMTMMGRVMQSYFYKPVQDAIGALVQWDKTLEDQITAFAYLEAYGMNTAASTKYFGETIDTLIEQGPRFQAAWLGLQAVLQSFAIRLLPTFTENVRQLMEKLIEMWPVLEVKLRPALEKLATETIPNLIMKLPELIPAFIALIDVLPEVVAAIGALVSSISPDVIAWFGRMIGVLVGLTPAMMAFGVALYFISPLLMAINTAMDIMHKLITSKVVVALALKIAAHYGHAAALSTDTAAQVANTSAQVANTAAKIPAVPITWALAAATAAVMAAIIAVVVAILIFTGKLGVFLSGVQAMMDIMTGTKKSFDQAAGSTYGFISAQEEMERKMESMYGRSIGTMIAEDMGEATEAMERYNLAVAGVKAPTAGAPGALLPGEATPQQIFITIPITVQTLYGEVSSLQELANLVGDVVAERVRRRGVT